MLDQQKVRLGQKIGKYRLVRKLGSGGFGTVYLAEDRRERTQVAIKVLHIPHTSGEDLKGFINEARTIELCHPHIVPLLSFGVCQDNLPFLVMEYAPEGTLRDRHPKGESIALPIIVSYVDQIASALQYAHDRHIIHRDVKPENILVRADRKLLVSDFGVAKFLEQSVLISRQTQVGTPAYMAPEQQMGHPCFASDQYALAVVIYEWICGVRPFQGTVLGLGVQHMNTPPPSLLNHLPELPEAVEHVIFKALSKAPEDRFERIDEMASTLRSAVQMPTAPVEDDNSIPLILSEQRSRLTTNSESGALARDATEVAPIEPAANVPLPIKRSTPTFPLSFRRTRVGKHRSGRRFSLLIGGVLGLLSLLVILILTFKPILFVQGRPLAPKTQQKAPSVTSIQQGQMKQKWIFFTDGRVASVSTMVNGGVYVSCSSSGSDNGKIYAIDTKTGKEKWVVPTIGVASNLSAQSGILYAQYHRNGETGDDKVHAIDAKTGQEKWAFPATDDLWVTAVSEVLNGILYVGSPTARDSTSGKVSAIDAETGQEKWAFSMVGVASELAIQSGLLYIGVYPPPGTAFFRVYAIDIKTGQEKWSFSDADGDSFALAVQNGVLYIESHHYGGPVAAGDELYAIDAETGQQKWAFPAAGSGASSLTPQSEVQNGILYVGSYPSYSSQASASGKVSAIDVETGQEKWSFPASVSWLMAQGGELYMGSYTPNSHRVHAIDARTGQEKWSLSISDIQDFSPMLVNGTLYLGSTSPDYNNIPYTSGGKVYAIDALTGKEKWAFPTGGPFFSLSTVANGELYAGSFDGTVYAWILPTSSSSRASE